MKTTRMVPGLRKDVDEMSSIIDIPVFAFDFDPNAIIPGNRRFVEGERELCLLYYLSLRLCSTLD